MWMCTCLFLKANLSQRPRVIITVGCCAQGFLLGAAFGTVPVLTPLLHTRDRLTRVRIVKSVTQQFSMWAKHQVSKKSWCASQDQTPEFRRTFSSPAGKPAAHRMSKVFFGTYLLQLFTLLLLLCPVASPPDDPERSSGVTMQNATLVFWKSGQSAESLPSPPKPCILPLRSPSTAPPSLCPSDGVGVPLISLALLS